MRGRRLIARALAIMLAATVGWSLLASCVEGATSTPAAQMACCKHGHHTCGMRSTPADCCKETPHEVGQFTAVSKFSSHPPHLLALPAFDAMLASTPAVWLPTATAYAPSPPPRSKHPAYLVFSTFRI